MNVNNSTAILIDGGFFLKRYNSIYKDWRKHTPEQVAKNLYTIAHKHIDGGQHLYRIFYYDALPFKEKAHNPITKKAIDFSKTDQYKFRMQFYEELKKKRKVALRMGILKNSGNWIIKAEQTKLLLSGKMKVEELQDSHVYYELRQKGIDMKIGVDIASLALKKFVNTIVLIAGDSDFVPASKLARREGIDFILDPMWNPIDASLFEHIDGLKSTCFKPKKAEKKVLIIKS